MTAGRTSNDVPLRVREAAFVASAAEGGAHGGTELADGSYAVWTLGSVTPGQLDNVTEDEQAQLRQQLAGAAGGSELNAYITELRSTATVIVNEEQFE